MQAEVGQRRGKEDVAQEHGDAHQYGAPVVELLRGDAIVEEVHPYHDQAGHVAGVEHQFGPCLFQPEVAHGIEHDAHRHDGGGGGDADVECLGSFLKSCFHVSVVFCLSAALPHGGRHGKGKKFL